jgi:hypothetical protein
MVAPRGVGPPKQNLTRMLFFCNYGIMHAACTDPRQCSHLVFLFLIDLTGPYRLFSFTQHHLPSFPR